MLILHTLHLISIFSYIILYAFQSNEHLSSHLKRINIIYGVIYVYYNNLVPDFVSFFNDQLYLTNHNSFTLMLFYISFLILFNFNREHLLIMTLAIGLINIFLSITPDAILLLWLTLEGITISAYLLMSQYIGNIKYYIISLFITNLSFFLFLFQFNPDIILSLLFLLKLGIYPIHQWIYSLYATTDLSILLFYHIILKFPIYIGLYHLIELENNNSLSILDNVFIFNYIKPSLLFIFIQFLAIFSSLQYSLLKFIGISSISLTASLLLINDYSYLYYYLVYIVSILMIFKIKSLLMKTLITMSILGIPPLPGFYAKLYLVNDIFVNHGILITILYLILILILASEYIRRFIINLDLKV